MAEHMAIDVKSQVQALDGGLSAPSTVIDVQNLSVAFKTHAGLLPVVHDVSFAIRAGETVALVGESGSGKSVTSLALCRLLPPAPNTQLRGDIRLHRTDGSVVNLTTIPEKGMERIRGNEISMIFQEPMTSLNPVLTVGDQIAEAIRCHRAQSQRSALEEAAHLLELVGIAEPRRRVSAYPHHMSGGMRQRVMIAMALACNPAVLIADEPTTALDVTVQAQILELLQEIQHRTKTAILFVTHNLGVVARIADRVMVMYAGRIVEEGPTRRVLSQPAMPYTKALLHSVPKLETAGTRSTRLESIPGSVPDPARLPPGCSYLPRCKFGDAKTCASIPQLSLVTADHHVRCHRWRSVQELGR